jgi:hypothetical protein
MRGCLRARFIFGAEDFTKALPTGAPMSYI